MDTYKLRKTRIVMTTFGSLGDLHPYIALAFEMQRRNIEPLIATSEIYREKVESAGIKFKPIRPSLPPLGSDEATKIIDRILDPKRGAEFLFKTLLAPAVRDSYDDLLEAVHGADLLITHPATLAGPLVAQKIDIPWISTVLAPASLWSDHDPIVPPNAPLLYEIMRKGGPSVTAVIRRAIEALTRSWLKPVYDLRKELGLPVAGNPIFSGQFSPLLNLALFSKAVYSRPCDIPANTLITGFPFYDGANSTQLTPELEDFLNDGPAPVVFTLGSSAVHSAGTFFHESIEAARLANQRAVLLIGPEGDLLTRTLPDGMISLPYAPYGGLFPQAAMVVHQGGIGTTGQTLRAGVPMLAMPYNHDQHDNAARAEKLGVGLTIERRKYLAVNVARGITRMLGLAYRERASQVGEQVRAEDGTGFAVESILRAIKGGNYKGITRPVGSLV